MSDQGGDPACWAHLPHGSDAPQPLVANLERVAWGAHGAVWSLPHGGDLDANLVHLEPGGRIGEHVNHDVDVLLFVQSGTASLRLGTGCRDLATDHLALIPRGIVRSIAAGPSGITYLSVHRRRSPLGVSRPGAAR
jgi:mannose-6-phosphate isomerase-like protein (cupin superfamily)